MGNLLHLAERESLCFLESESFPFRDQGVGMISDIVVYLGVLPIDVTVVPRETLVEMRLKKGKWFAQGHKESYRVRFRNGLPLPDTMVLAVHSVNST